jgi:hypothetical protein
MEGCNPTAMNNTKNSLFLTLYAIVVKGKNHYSVARPATLLGLLYNFHGIEIKKRWLYQCMMDIADAGYIRRRRRFRQQGAGEIRRLPQMVVITNKGVKYLKAKMVSGAATALKKMLTWLKRVDGRFPRPQDVTHPQPITDTDAALAHIKEIIKEIG